MLQFGSACQINMLIVITQPYRCAVRYLRRGRAQAIPRRCTVAELINQTKPAFTTKGKQLVVGPLRETGLWTGAAEPIGGKPLAAPCLNAVHEQAVPRRQPLESVGPCQRKREQTHPEKPTKGGRRPSANGSWRA
jgi:hypothetical protein